jgi:bisphosphoglycerate-independent phosphoglycerate mutase (AlkP superfamily)
MGGILIQGHSQATDDTRKIILITSDSSLIQSTYIKKQCDIAPTVLNYFDVSKDKYQESITAGCIGL